MAINNNDKTAREELIEWIKNKFNLFIEWLKPNPTDRKSLQMVKTVLKIPVVLLAIAVSPIFLILLGLVFFLVL